MFLRVGLFSSVPFLLQVLLPAAVSSPVEESEAGFTGRRLNSKMQVYSGSKTAYLPKMMSLYQQCIRVLSNNIDCKCSSCLLPLAFHCSFVHCVSGYGGLSP